MGVWGIGTGRCGTRSLARDLGGVHEPKPHYGPEATLAYWGSPAARQRCWVRLQSRLALGVPVVDLHHSLLIGLICQVDPQAEFIWLIRHPMTCVASFLAGGGWTAQNGDGATLWRPQAGWPDTYTRLDKAIRYWCEVNALIERGLEACGRPWQLRLTEELVAHDNAYPKNRQWRYTPEEAAQVMDACGGAWQVGAHQMYR